MAFQVAGVLGAWEGMQLALGIQQRIEDPQRVEK